MNRPHSALVYTDPLLHDLFIVARNLNTTFVDVDKPANIEHNDGPRNEEKKIKQFLMEPHMARKRSPGQVVCTAALPPKPDLQVATSALSTISSALPPEADVLEACARLPVLTLSGHSSPKQKAR